MTNQITAQELRILIEKTRISISDAKEAVKAITQILDNGSFLSEEVALSLYGALKICADSWNSLKQISESAGDAQNISAYDSLLSDLEKAESLDSLRNTVTAFFQIVSSSEKYSQILEDAKKELQNCCRLETSKIAHALLPYEITVRAIQGENISDEDDDILMENNDAVHQVYFKRLKMSIDVDKNVAVYMDGSCQLLTNPAAIAEHKEKTIKPLWENFAGYISDNPIYIENNPESEKPFQAKEFASRVKTHPNQFDRLGKINDNVLWPIEEPESWNDHLDDITYFLNHGYIVKVGYNADQPLFYMLSAKGKHAVEYYWEKIKKQPKAKFSQGNYPDISQLTVVELKRIHSILNQVMIDNPGQYGFLRATKEWQHFPCACAYEKDTGRDLVLTSGYFSVGNEITVISEIEMLCQNAPNTQIMIIVASMDDSQAILKSASLDAEVRKRISFIEAH